MANPIIVVALANQWTKVATAVTGGVIDQMTDDMMLQTYRETGEAAPTEREEGVQWEGQMEISNNTAIDIYIWSEVEGKVRVSI